MMRSTTFKLMQGKHVFVCIRLVRVFNWPCSKVHHNHKGQASRDRCYRKSRRCASKILFWRFLVLLQGLLVAPQLETDDA